MRSLCLRPEDFGRQESGTDIGAPAAAAGARRAASGCAECVCEMPANQANLEVRGASARRSSEGVCRPRLPGQLLVRALRKKFSWRLLDSQRGVVFAAKRKLVELQAAGCGGFVQEGRAVLPGRVDLDCPWISGVLLLADNGFAPACVGEAGGLFCLNAWHVEAQKLLPCWGSVAGELPAAVGKRVPSCGEEPCVQQRNAAARARCVSVLRSFRCTGWWRVANGVGV